MPPSRRSGCPIAYGLDLFGDRWSLLVLRDTIFEGKRRFAEFLASDEHVSTNILAARLEQLTWAGLIQKADDPADKRSAVYTPTPKGLDLIPLLLEFVRWSGKHDAKTDAPPEFLAALERDRDGIIAMVRSRFADPANPPGPMFSKPPAAPKAKAKRRSAPARRR